MPGTPSPSAGLCESALHAIAGAGLWRANWLQHRRAPEQGRRAWRSRRAVIWVDFALEPCVKRAIGVELPLSKARGNCFRVPCGFLGSGLSRQPSLPPPLRSGRFPSVQASGPGAVPGEEGSEEEQASPAAARLWDTTGGGPSPSDGRGGWPSVWRPSSRGRHGSGGDKGPRGVL